MIRKIKLPWDQSGSCLNKQLSICLQCPKISVLELSVASSGLNAILNFSLRHSLHVLFTGLNDGIFLSKIFHSTLGSFPPSFSFQNGSKVLLNQFLTFFHTAFVFRTSMFEFFGYSYVVFCFPLIICHFGLVHHSFLVTGSWQWAIFFL